jgi:hypothetical protein
MLLAACGGGGGGGGGDGDGGGPTVEERLAPLTAAQSDVPLVGNLIADCGETGVAVADSLVDTVNGLDALPLSLPTLSEVIDLADLDRLPIVGGLVAGSQGGELLPIPLDTVLGLLPLGVGDLADQLVAGQLPVLCSTLLADLPLGVLGDPEALTGALGSPVSALGVIPIFDQANNPVGSVLTVVLAGVPALASLVLGPLSVVPVVGPLLASLVGTVLGLLADGGLLGGLLGGGDGGLLGGGLLGIVLGLLP